MDNIKVTWLLLAVSVFAGLVKSRSTSKKYESCDELEAAADEDGPHIAMSVALDDTARLPCHYCQA